jgi:hypothetical protein
LVAVIRRICERRRDRSQVVSDPITTGRFRWMLVPLLTIR